MISEDEKYMQRCLDLAVLGAGSVAPNPMVGSVVVYEGQIIGEGFTSPYGGNHAEVNAIQSVEDKSLLPHSTMYVSLEPCAHFGQTPPCANLLVEYSLKRVVIAIQDPFANVNGAGIKKLKNGSIDVTVGVLETEANELNRRFLTFHKKQRPYIILKWAETDDGFVDKKRSDAKTIPLKITGNPANMLVHKWRAEEAAILVGKNTVLLDNPSLTTRKYAGQNPIRILLDSNEEVPQTSNFFSGNTETITFKENSRNLEKLLKNLHERDIQSVLVEGGPQVHQSFYELGYWDEIRRFVAPFKIERGVEALQVSELPESNSRVGDDTLFIYRNR